MSWRTSSCSLPLPLSFCGPALQPPLPPQQLRTVSTKVEFNNAVQRRLRGQHPVSCTQHTYRAGDWNGKVTRRALIKSGCQWLISSSLFVMNPFVVLLPFPCPCFSLVSSCQAVAIDPSQLLAPLETVSRAQGQLLPHGPTFSLSAGIRPGGACIVGLHET